MIGREVITIPGLTIDFNGENGTVHLQRSKDTPQEINLGVSTVEEIQSMIAQLRQELKRLENSIAKDMLENIIAVCQKRVEDIVKLN